MKKNTSKENNTKTSLKASLREKISYGFDNLMARGMSAQAGMLFLVTMVVTVIFGTVVYFVYPQLVDTLYLGIWTTFMHMIDGGTITGDQGGFWYMFVMLVVTLIGLVVTATLISIINESLSTKMEKLRKGNSRVLEKGHTIILGFSEGIYTIIENLMIANESENGGTIVIMDEIKSKAEMEDEINKWISHKKKEDKEKKKYKAQKYKTKIICRNGDIANKKAVSMCSPEVAKSIIVNCADDFMTVKAILAAAGNLNENTQTQIVAEVKDEDYQKTAVLAGKIGNDKSRIHVVYADEFVSRIIAHTGRQPGISEVLTEFLGFEGMDIYVEDVPQILMPEDGKEYTVYEANLSSNNAVVIGIKQKKKKEEKHMNSEPAETVDEEAELMNSEPAEIVDEEAEHMNSEPAETVDEEAKLMNSEPAEIVDEEYKIILNPEPKTRIKKDDKLILLQEDNGEFEKYLTSIVAEEAPKEITHHNEEKVYKKTVIFGYSTKIPTIINESRSYLSEDSEFIIVWDDDDGINQTVLTAKDKKKQETIKKINEIKNNGAKIKGPYFKDLYKGKEYAKFLSSKGVGCVLILSDYSIDPEVNDANVLGMLLRVREFKESNHKEYSITTEMVKSENKELAVVKENSDYIVSEDITNKIITQISENADLHMVFDELLKKEGAEIYMHKFGDYLSDYLVDKTELDKLMLDYKEMFKIAAKKGHTLIGYRDDDTKECHINPPKNEPIPYNKENSFIVLGEGCGN